MKSLFRIGAFLLLIAAGVSAQTRDTVKVVAEYNVKITDLWHLPHFLGAAFGWLGQQLGMAPKCLNYSETDIDSAGENVSFCMSLKDQGGREWLQAYSDTTQRSFIDPTQVRAGLLSKAVLHADVIRFVTDIRDFFQCGTGGRFHGRFVLWKDTVDFYAARDTADPGVYRLSSFNSRQEPYIRGSVLVARKDGYNVYPWMRLDLLKPGTGVILEISDVKVEK